MSSGRYGEEVRGEIENTYLKFPHLTFRKHLRQWNKFIFILSVLNMFYLGCGNG